MPKCVGGIGSKSISAFNLVMLSKQAWRFMTSHDSLVSAFINPCVFLIATILTLILVTILAMCGAASGTPNLWLKVG